VVLEAQAMDRPVIVSDLGAGPDAVLAPAAALIRLFLLPESARAAIGARGRAWMVTNFNAPAVAESMLRLYAEVTRRRARL
jgi:glycosyltransferase involved in cell wall biosynthesis